MRHLLPPLTLASALAGLTLSGAALAAPPQVVADIPPVHSLVAAVMGDLGEPELLLDKGASEHHFQLRPSQMASLSRAGLLVHVSPLLTPWLEKAVADDSGRLHLELLSVKGTEIQAYGAAGDDRGGEHDHGHDHGHDGHTRDTHEHEDHGEEHGDDHESDHGHDHTHEGPDPHAWLDPGNAMIWLDAIAAELARLDPDNAATYAANAARARDAIAQADAEARQRLEPVAEKPFVTFHDAYGYFAAHYRLQQLGSVALGDANTPGARHLNALREGIAASERLCLFPEAQHDEAAIRKLAEEGAAGGAVVGGALDPVGSTLEPGPELYPALIRTLAATIADCLAGE